MISYTWVYYLWSSALILQNKCFSICIVIQGFKEGRALFKKQNMGSEDIMAMIAHELSLRDALKETFCLDVHGDTWDYSGN